MSLITNFIGKPLNITLGIAGLVGIVWLILCRDRLRMHWAASVPLSAGLVVYSVYAVKLFALIEAGFDISKSGGMSLYGVPFFTPILLFAGAKAAKRPTTEIFDIFTVNTVLICMGGRANCFFYGCCIGVEIPGTSFRVPTREIEMVFYFLLLLYLVPRVYKKQTHGAAFPIYMAGYGLLRFVLEFFRNTNFDTVFHPAHFWSLLCAVMGLSFISTIYGDARRRGHRSV